MDPAWTPRDGSAEAWAARFIESDDLAFKLDPPKAPREWDPDAQPLRIDTPGRPAELVVASRGRRTPGPDALRNPRRRAELLHTFLHHELQAAELMCRTVLAFPDSQRAFRQGLIHICQDEIRHMRMYAEHIERLGHAVGDFPVNDWFWRRAPQAGTPAEFVALMGLGFEAANLDHTARFEARFEAVGDTRGAALQRRVGEEELPHVAFGIHWFPRLAGRPLSFDSFRAALPPPLSPMLMRGRPINRDARLRAGLDADFIDQLAAWEPEP